MFHPNVDTLQPAIFMTSVSYLLIGSSIVNFVPLLSSLSKMMVPFIASIIRLEAANGATNNVRICIDIISDVLLQHLP